MFLSILEDPAKCSPPEKLRARLEAVGIKQARSDLEGASRRRCSRLQCYSEQCAAIVRHAKRVALEKKKREQQSRALKIQWLKRKLERAEVRRSALKHGKMPRLEAAHIVYRAMRVHHTALLRRKLYLKLNALFEKPIEQVMATIADRSVITACTKALGTFGLTRSTRVFLSLFCILDKNTQDHKSGVKVCAKELYQSFAEAIDPNIQNSFRFLARWRQYLQAFDQWKMEDQKEVIAFLVNSYRNLEEMKNLAMSSKDEYADQVLAEVHTSQTNLERKLVTLVGSQSRVNEILRDAVPLNEHVPETKQRPKLETGHYKADTATPVRLNLAENIVLDSNLNLTHELIMNPEFQLQNEISIESFMNPADMNVLEAGKEERVGLITSLAKTFREYFDKVICGNETLKTHTDEILDVEFIKDQCERDAYDFWAMCEVVVDHMALLCSPARDDLVHQCKDLVDQAARIPEHSIDAVRHILYTFELMKIDVANHQISEAAAKIPRDALIAYEKNMIHSRDLSRTNEWILEGIRYAEFCAEGVFEDKVRTLYERKLTHCLMKDDFSLDYMPESFEADKTRLAVFRKRSTRIIQISGVCLTVLSSKPNDTELVAQLQTEIVSQLTDLDDTFDIATIIKLSQDPVIQRVAERVWNGSDTTVSILRRRLCSILQKEVVTDKILEAHGFKCTKVLVKQLHKDLRPFLNLHWQIYGDTYCHFIRMAAESHN
ncbi:hypothetical protein CANCADRAFT_106970 [Tortispora caseinolytica NRRL Y-17796]|uniref:Uncharacterized protein n=1 Tax=Tortispora caseinolytica NRRL Y-17796 TaxID=767744 RepID=A0A1E4TFD3_9ASCO|nr:hypothetical protein CANCADRAFT_106970 [Tortispora caseinolytica NRRL Y-17796]